METRIILKTTADGEAVRATEINSISVDLRNKALAYNEQEVIIDLTNEEYKLPGTYSRFSVNFSAESGTAPAKAARAEAAAQAIFNILKNYHLECVAEESEQQEGGQQ